MPRITLLTLLASLAACAQNPPNVKSAGSYSAPEAPPVRNPIYNPYAPYGEANATWRAPVYNRDGTVVKPAEPASQYDRPSYETAPWASGAAGGDQDAPPGTF